MIDINLDLPSEPVTKRIDTEVSIDLFKSVKIYAALKDVSVKDFVALCLNNEINRLNATSLIQKHVDSLKYLPMHPFPESK